MVEQEPVRGRGRSPNGLPRALRRSSRSEARSTVLRPQLSVLRPPPALRSPELVERGVGAFTLLELLTVITIIAILAGIVIGVGRRASEAGKTARAKAELAAVSVALETYKRQYGDYPQNATPAQLLQALVGKLNPKLDPMTGRTLLDLAHLRVLNDADPFTSTAAQLSDPWDRAYVYAYKSQAPWTNPGFVLYSIGPDGKDAADLLAGGLADTSKPDNTDNIYANHY